MSRARDSGLDLVEVGPTEKPPVCRIMDYGKYKYQKSKKQNRSHVHQTKIKEIRLRPKIGEHDVNFKIKQAIGFLKHNDKVQLSVVFRGREIAHEDEGRKVVEHVMNELLEFGKIERPPTKQGRRITCVITPK